MIPSTVNVLKWNWSRSLLRLAAMIGVAAAVVVAVAGAGAHAELERSQPPDEGLLAAPPERLDLWFTEPVATGPDSPSLRLVDDQGRDQELENVRVDPEDAHHVTADVPVLAPGTYTVAWGVRSDTDGHSLTGRYAFRVGGGRAPGAATVAGEDPPVWAVAARWLTFLGAALVAGGGLFGLVVAPGAASSVRSAGLALIGGGVALLATLAEPLLQTQFPPGGASDPTLRETVRALPDAWWWRPPCLALALLACLAWWWQARRGRPAATLVLGAALAVGLGALLGLSLTGHGSGRDSLRWLAVTSDALHQWAVALWVGGLVFLGVWRCEGESWTDRRIGGRSLLGLRAATEGPVGRFSRIALPLAGIGIATGILNAGLVLPALESLWGSTYGKFLLTKVAVLVPVLGLATFHRVKLRQLVGRAAVSLRPSVRAEAALAVVVILGGSILALLAPPISEAGEATFADLAVPIDTAQGDSGPALHLRVEPAAAGENGVQVYLAEAAKPPDPPVRVPFAEDAQVALLFTSLSHVIEPASVLATADGDGGFRAEGLKLSLDGWWQVEVVVRQGRQPEIREDYYLLLPDPNIHGFGSVRNVEEDPAARAVFERGLAGMTGLHRVRWTERLADGNANVAFANFAVNDGSDGSPPAMSQATSRVAIVRVGDREWLRRTDGEWAERAAGVMVPPSEWGETYAGATNLQLGPVMEVGGEQAQVVTMYVPESDRQSEAWFTWWVGVDSGRVLREAMVARSHYMVRTFQDFDGDVVIESPSGDTGTPTADSTPAEGTPPAVATPKATPVGSRRANGGST